MKMILTLAMTCLLVSNLFATETMDENMKPKIAITITLKAQPGMEGELTNLLTIAANIVKETEPQTLYWFATQIDDNTFTINDGFANEAGVNAHFEGKVASILKENAERVVQGGWEDGVVRNIVRSEILSTIQ